MFSSQPSYNLPNFSWADMIIKKGSHVFVYGFLSLSYWYALGWERKRRWVAWTLSILYSCTDEFHQSFVPGRHPWIWDILIFDNLGALVSLWFADRRIKDIQPED